MKQLIACDAAGRPSPLIRPYRPDDADRLRAITLSRRSLHERFFVGTPRLPDHYLNALDRIDHVHHEALVAVAASEIIGIAEYVREPAAPTIAHLSVMVADAWHRRGVAGRLVTPLIELARSRGIADLRADVLATNRPAMAAIRSRWPTAASTRDTDGTTTFLLPLTPAQRAVVAIPRR